MCRSWLLAWAAQQHIGPDQAVEGALIVISPCAITDPITLWQLDSCCRCGNPEHGAADYRCGDCDHECDLEGVQP